MEDSKESAAATPVPAPDRAPHGNGGSFSKKVKYWLKSVLSLRHDTSLKEALEETIEDHEEQGDERLAPEERVMLHNVLSFGDTQVEEIMVPRADITAVASDISLPDLKKHIIKEHHTRIPVYDETLDHVLGFVHIKDLLPMLSADVPYDIQKVMRKLLFVPPSMRIIDLLVRMRDAGSHMAIVVDEHGGTDGLITMEDLFEEIVGDIQDEHDEDEETEHKITRINATTLEVSARIPIEQLEEELGLKLVTEERGGEYDTLGGLIFFQLGRVPARNEVIPHVTGIRFEIAEVDARRIRKVRVITG